MWFKEDLSFVYGLSEAINPLAITLAGLTLEPLYNVYDNLFLPIFFCAVICTISFFLSFLVNYYDTKASMEETPD